MVWYMLWLCLPYQMKMPYQIIEYFIYSMYTVFIVLIISASFFVSLLCHLSSVISSAQDPAWSIYVSNLRDADQ